MNRDRITTLLILAAIAGLAVYIAFHTYWGDETLTTPLQGEAATNRYYSVERLLHAVGVRTQRIASLRVLPPTSSVLFVDDLRVDVAHTTQESLEHWVERGGRLVITSSVDWQNPHLQTWSGIAPVAQKDTPEVAKPPTIPRPGQTAPPPGTRPSTQPGMQPPRRVRRPTAPDSDCKPLVEKRHGEATGATLRVCSVAIPAFQSERVPDWQLSNDDGLQFARVAIGRGSLTLIGSPFLLGVRNFLRADDAQAFVDSVPLARGDQLSILSPSQAEPFVALLWRLAAPAIVLFGVAALLLIWRNLPRFGPLAPVPIAARRSLAEQIRANARFAWRTRKLGALREAARRALDRDAAKKIAGYAALDTRERAAELGKHAGVDPAVLDAAMSRHPSDAAPVERAAIALLEQTRRTLNLSPRQKGIA
jgi:hypothetical protein